jgi:hypothetical protein
MGICHFFGTLGIILLTAVSAAEGTSQTIFAPQSASTPGWDFERIGPGRLRIGHIILDKSATTTPTITMPARVNMQKGLIELVACSNGGKVWESIFVADVEPRDLNLALLLLGLNFKGGVKFQGDATLPEGDKVIVFVEKDGKRRRVEDYVWDVPRKAPMERAGWVFSGSKFINGQFGAQVTRTLIATQHDPYTILDNPMPTGADSSEFEVNSQVTPPVGTTVTLVIQPAKKAETNEAKGEAK